MKIKPSQYNVRCKGGIYLSHDSCSFSLFSSLHLTLVSGNMCFRAGLEIHLKAGSQKALWVTEMERTEHKEKRALSLSHSLLLSLNFPPT